MPGEPIKGFCAMSRRLERSSATRKSGCTISQMGKLSRRRLSSIIGVFYNNWAFFLPKSALSSDAPLVSRNIRRKTESGFSTICRLTEGRVTDRQAGIFNRPPRLCAYTPSRSAAQRSGRSLPRQATSARSPDRYCRYWPAGVAPRQDGKWD